MKVENNNKLEFLDSIRGLAAIYVMVGHARWLLWEGWSSFKLNSSQYDVINKGLVYASLFFKYGHEMVIFFFILSGFVIHLNYATKLKTNSLLSFDLVPYIKRRFFRIFPPFFFALILTFLADKVVEINGFTIFQHLTPEASINKTITFDHGVTTFFGNLFFLQGGFVPIFGSNGPLWSLMYEWWFYMLYPLLFLLYRKNIFISYFVVVLLLIFFLVGGTTTIVLFDKVLSYLFIWWLGVVLADIYVNRIIINKKVLFPLVIFLPLIPILHVLKINALLSDTITALGVFGFFMILFYWFERKRKIMILLGKCSFLGRPSYTLYVIHFPLLVMYNGILLNINNNVFPFTFIHVLISVVGIYYISSMVSGVVERRWTVKK